MHPCGIQDDTSVARTASLPEQGGGRRTRGFSLIELILVIVIVGIIATVGAQLMGTGFQMFFTARDTLSVDAQARLALERMTRELRAVRQPADLVIAPATEITFTDSDGTLIRYCLATVSGCPGTTIGDLMRNGQTLAGGVSGLGFTYLASNGTVATSAAQVLYIGVQFSATQGGVSGSYRATVSPRTF